MMNNNLDDFSCGPHLIMVIEPETRIRFRYKSEGSSHGGLQGKRKEKGKKIYPTVKLEGYEGNKQVYIRVSLYTEDRKRHVLEFMGQSEENLSYIEQYLQEDNTAEFTNVKILSKKKEEIVQLLMDRKMEKLRIRNKCVRTQFEKENNKELKERAKDIMNSVRLCFEAFEENSSVPLCEPLFSELICNHKAASKSELRIHRMSRVSGSCRGGDEIILLCDKVQKGNIEVIFYETDVESDSKEDWEGKALFTPADVHYQVAITFKTPPYKMNTEKTVFVSLARNGEKGDPVEFTYIPDFEGKPSKKRKIYPSQEPVSPIEYSDNSTSSDFKESETSSVHESQQVKNDFNILDSPDLEILKDFAEEMRDITIDIEELETICNDFSFEDLMPDNVVEIHPERVFNQSLDILPPIGLTEIDGVISAEMNRVAINESSNYVKQKSENKVKSEERSQIDIHKINEQIQQKIYSLLTKKDNCGNTFLHIAVYKNKNVEYILKMSQFANADIINVKNYYQETALHIATQKNNKEVVKILLKSGCNPNFKNAEGNNCYHIASEGNYFDIMCYLLTLVTKPELNAFNYEGLTPLHIAVIHNSKECYQLLKFHSACINTVDKKHHRSLLHYAVKFQPSFVTILLNEVQIDVNIQDFEGNTPLHLACSIQNTEIVKQLLKAGADPSLKNFKQNNNLLENTEDDVDGQMPEDLALNSEIVEILRQAPNKIPKMQEVMKKLCSLLDKDGKWKDIAIYVMDEKFISSLECNPSPTEALLLHIQKEQRSGFIDHLKTVFNMTGPKEALDIIKDF